MMKTEGELQDRARKTVMLTALLTFVLFAVAGYWVANGIDGYTIVKFAGTEAASNPLNKDVAVLRVPGCRIILSIHG